MRLPPMRKLRPLERLVTGGLRQRPGDQPLCAFSDLPVDSCAHCTGRTGNAEAREPAHYGPWFDAAYPGRCQDCDERIEPGGRIRADGEGGYLCAECGREEDRP
jgi:hypothetical protein